MSAFRQHNQLGVEEVVVDHDRARELTACNASYLWLTRQRGVNLVTLD